MKNYRPVSNIPIISKLIEKIVSSRILQHLAFNNLHTNFQSAYKKHHSTESALLRVANDILRYIDNKKSVLLILLDLSAAFDTIDHDILLARAHSRFGIDGKALYWLNAYLKNRTQTVSIDNNKATPSPLKYGVPQGSVLGPLLFTMYTAPVADIAERHGVNYHLYADDTQLYVPLDNTLETASYQKESIEKCVVEIADWMNSNKLKLQCKVYGSKERARSGENDEKDADFEDEDDHYIDYGDDNDDDGDNDDDVVACRKQGYLRRSSVAALMIEAPGGTCRQTREDELWDRNAVARPVVVQPPQRGGGVL
ncbi:hypothetical protein RRG08_027924 [Elysia crispata]|uniref:Reverse transcriptase domain-containing protein n=1 Tax=Elysia crispata TaxID=231223 RepID=A0AAE1A7D1_9GAST|nr:hypothetical protein RRG08_027924 [Elysia crispata]